MKSITEQILEEIAEHESGWCFSQKDFLGIAGRNAIEQAFYRLFKEGAIRRIGRGLYDVPEYSEMLQTVLGPHSHEIAQAVARKFGWRIIPTGAQAANMLNLSTQVPMKVVYLSDGPTKAMTFENRTIYFKKTAPKKLAASELGALLINAFQYLGKTQITTEVIAGLNRCFDAEQKRQLLEDAQFAPDWVYEAIKKICAEGVNDE